MADSVALRNFAVESSSSGENFGQRAFAQQIASDFPQRFAGVKDVAIRVNTREHGGEALEIAEAQKRLDSARRSVDGLNCLSAPFDDFSDQLEIARIFDQAKIGQLFVQRGLRREDKALLAGPV